tara:strand:+ start:303 stop:620 length:318 start_codon:yes stop_codon:yes gene_type:complete
MEIKHNITSREYPYKFNNLKGNSCAVFVGPVTVNLYVDQSCNACGYCAIGYYKYIRTPQHFKCSKCLHEWSIAVKDGVNSVMDEREKQMIIIDRAMDALKKLEDK